LLVFTFVLCLGIIFKANDLLARGVSWMAIVRFTIYGIPEILSMTIPVSVMTTCLLMFGRLSSDGEITAMRASGISMSQIASRPLFLAFLLSVVCLYNNMELSPRSHYARRSLKAEVRAQNPIDLLEEGRFIQDFPGFILYVGRRNGMHLENVRIYDLRTKDVKREIRGKSGKILVDPNGNDMIMELYDVRVDPFFGNESMSGFIGKYTITVKDAFLVDSYTKRSDDLTMTELLEHVTHMNVHSSTLSPEDQAQQKMILMVEFHRRLVLAMACIAFAILSIPLGVKAHRKESSLGILMSLSLFAGFYFFMIVVENLVSRPELRPDLITWIPVGVSLLLGSWLIKRTD
jgi:lipopolysaccharide export system permease protein